MAKLEYDESGVTSSYFLVFLYGLFLLVATYFLWPRSKKSERRILLFSDTRMRLSFTILIPFVSCLGILDGKLICQCGPCSRKKTKLEAQQPRKKLKLFAKYGGEQRLLRFAC